MFLKWFVFCLASALCVAGIQIQSQIPSPVADYAAELLKERIGLLAGQDILDNIAIHLIIENQPDNQHPETYEIQIKNQQIYIRAYQPAGILYGAAALIEWIIGQTTPGLLDRSQVDIDFPVLRNQASQFFEQIPEYFERSAPDYDWRGLQMHILALGVMDLIDIEQHEKKYNVHSGNPGPFRQGVDEWKKWCDWAARHRMNYITNWPYAAGTNWWELAYDPATAKMTVYTKEQIGKAADVRESLLKYAQNRGIRPFLMNYVAGAPTPTIRQNYPHLLGVKPVPHYPDPFCLANPELKRLFQAQIKAIVRTYPSLAGFHLRWWGESFACYCEKCKDKFGPLVQDLTLSMIEAAIEERPDIKILISGWFRMGGTKDFADRLPKGNVILQSKWGIDWEPTSFPDIPFHSISELNHPFLISQNFPAEEFHAVGGVHYKPTYVGFFEYDNARRRGVIPNLSGLAVVMGEKDYEWITGLNYIVAAKLNWSVQKTDVDILAKNYIGANCGFEVADLMWEALDITQRVFEDYVHDFNGVVNYVDCARFYSMFGFERVEKMDLRQLRAALPIVHVHAQMMRQAAQKAETAKNIHCGKGAEFFKDVYLQTLIFADFFESRRLMVEAFISKRLNRADLMVEYLNKIRDLDQNILSRVNAKPNISDDFEFDGMKTPYIENLKIQAEIAVIDQMIQKYRD